MGTDIHAVFQKKTEGKWEDIPHNYEEKRHYFLFSWLAGVRNGYGFAGVPTYDPIMPIAEQRGLPEDFEMEGDSHPIEKCNITPSMQEDFDEKDPFKYMGDHSYSWLLGSEILKAPKPGRVTHYGVVDRETYDSWDRKSPPEEWCASISVPGVVVSTHPLVFPETTHVAISWESDSANHVKYFTDEIQSLVDLHGEIRIVFGFDS